ncbi:MAG: ThiF family adenylyltransferase [Pyrinomonadaceae bacterium]
MSKRKEKESLNVKKGYTRRELLSGAGAAMTAAAIFNIPNVAEGGQTKSVYSSPDYRLQKMIRELKIPASITILGTGRFGSWVGFYAAMAGVQKISIIDPANLDASDIASLPFTSEEIGKPKVTALKELILSIRPKADVQAKVQLFDAVKDAEFLHGVIFNGASDKALHRQLPAVVQRRKLKYVAGGYNGMDVAVWDYKPKTLNITEGADSHNAPVWVGSAAMSALLALQSAFAAPINFAGSLNNLNQKRPALEKSLIDMPVSD